MADAAANLIIYTDGGSRGNPGPAAAAFVLYNEKKILLQSRGMFLGSRTNNFAEYTAVIKALEAAKQIGARRLKIYSDSELLVRQINGLYKVKSDNIRTLFEKASRLLGGFEKWQVKHIIRDKNQAADRLVNQALNLKMDVQDKPVLTEEEKKTLRLGVLISGGGRTLLNILEYVKNGKLNVQVPVVISSRSAVAGVERAEKAGLNVRIVRKKDYPDVDEFSSVLEKELAAADVDLVIQAGWMCYWKIPARYKNRVMNIHPALLPCFGGKGMWGHHVHEAVLKTGCKVSGCTVHFCTNEYDKGPIIVQKCCPVMQDDTPDTLAARVFKQECIAYPEAIRLFHQKRLAVYKGRVEISKNR